MISGKALQLMQKENINTNIQNLNNTFYDAANNTQNNNLFNSSH